VRIQTLILPSPEGECRFALVLDEVPHDAAERLQDRGAALASKVGAVTTLVFPESVEVL
jgi:hypothetical protein